MRVLGQLLYIWLMYALFDLTLEIMLFVLIFLTLNFYYFFGLEFFLTNLTLGIRLKEMGRYFNMNKRIIYSNSMKTNRNELIRRLLSGVTDDELENLVRVREEARRPIPAPRKMGVK